MGYPRDGCGVPLALPGSKNTKGEFFRKSPTKAMDILYTPETPNDYVVRRAYLYNAAAGCTCGLGSRFATTRYECGQISAVGVYTSDTEDFTDAGANDFPVSTLVNNTGCILAADRKWNLSQIVVGTAHVGGAPAYALSYWNGSAWADLTGYLIDTPSFGAAATTYLFFGLPPDWATGGKDDAGTAIAALVGKYAIKIKATTAPTTTAALISSGLLGCVTNVKEFGATTGITLDTDAYPVIVEKGDSLTPYWGTANAASYANGSGDQFAWKV